MLQRAIFNKLLKWTATVKPVLYNGVVKSCSTLSSNEAKVYSEADSSGNDVVNPEFTNRNPRNLEFMGLDKKRKGWKFQYPTRTFYHRLVFESSKYHTSAFVEHCNGEVILSASTKEYCISRHLYSTRDVTAAKNIGRVIALRCLQAGIVNMILKDPEVDVNSKKFGLFCSAIEAGGIDLFEPEEIQPPYQPGIDYDDEEELRDIYDRQMRVHNLAQDHAVIKKLRKIRNFTGSIKTTPQKPISLDNDNHRIKPF